MSLFLSVIVPTYNRTKQLEKLVSWLKAQSVDRKHSEIIVVNDGSSDGSRIYLDSLDDCWFIVVHQSNQGQARARTAGVEKARGEVLLFLDDDMEPGSADFLENHLLFHEKSAVRTVALGAILPPRENYWRPAFEHFFEKSIHLIYEGFRQGTLQPSGLHFFSANVSLRKQLYVESGGFSPSFIQAEDRELGLRLEYDFGAQFSFLEPAHAYHHSPTGYYRSFLRRAYLYGRYDLKMAKYYPEHDELSPYQIFAKPPLSKMVIAKSTWTMPGFMTLFNQPLIIVAKLLHRLGFTGPAIRCCSILYCINFVLGLKDEHNYDI